VAEDVGTTVTGIQSAITLYTLVMAMLRVAGGEDRRCRTHLPKPGSIPP
jgi:hypothetical protein